MTQTQNLIHAQEEVLLAWEAAQWAEHHRGKTWWVVAGTLVMAAIIFALIYDAWSAALAFAMLAATYYLLSHEKPETQEIVITDFAIHIDEEFWQYSQIRHFWIIYHPSSPQMNALQFEIKQGHFTKVKNVLLEDMSPVKVRDVLARQIPEAEGREERGMDFWARVLKI